MSSVLNVVGLGKSFTYEDTDFSDILRVLDELEKEEKRFMVILKYCGSKFTLSAYNVV